MWSKEMRCHVELSQVEEPLLLLKASCQWSTKRMLLLQCLLLSKHHFSGELMHAAPAGEYSVPPSLSGSVGGALFSGVREAARASKLLLQVHMRGEAVDLEVSLCAAWSHS